MARYTSRLAGALPVAASRHRLTYLFFDSVRLDRRVGARRAPAFADATVVRATGIPNAIFTFAPLLVPALAGPWTVERFLGPVDVFHSTNAVVLPQRSGRRVVTVHDLSCLQRPDLHPPLRRVLFALGLRHAARAADALIVPSRATEAALIARHPEAAGKVHVVPLAPDAAFRPLGRDAVTPVLARYGLADRQYLLFVGNLEPRKNLAALIGAYARLRGRRARPPLVLAGGQGWRNADIERALRGSPDAADIRRLGFVDDGTLPALMGGAALLVYPSLLEGFGLPPLEAMACGTPVVASTAPALCEVVGDAALLVDPHDVDGLAAAIGRVLTDEALWHDLRARGLRRAAGFTWQDAARRTVRVYESASRSARGTAGAPRRG